MKTAHDIVLKFSDEHLTLDQYEMDILKAMIQQALESVREQAAKVCEKVGEKSGCDQGCHHDDANAIMNLPLGD